MKQITAAALEAANITDNLEFSEAANYVAGNGPDSDDGYSLRALNGLLQIATADVVEYYEDTEANRAQLIAEMTQNA